MDSSHNQSTWSHHAVQQMRRLLGRSETPLREITLHGSRVRLILKDESAHPSGSLKHRLAGSLLMFGLCNGDIGPHTTLVEASSGSTAVSEAWYARELGLDFVAVMPAGTSPRKLDLIESLGGICHLVEDPLEVYSEAERLGAQPETIYLDQFSNASVTTNWRSSNIASSFFAQLADRGLPDPDWVVVGAGTGGTASTFARYSRYTAHTSRILVADPEGSAYYRAWMSGSRSVTGTPSRIEGIGRPRVEPSFVPQLIDRVIPVMDDWSVGAMHALGELGISCGPSTGTNLVGALLAARRLHVEQGTGLVASVICDGAERYQDTYLDDRWLARRGLHPHEPQRVITSLLRGEIDLASEWLTSYDHAT